MARMGKELVHAGFFMGEKMKERDHLEDLGVNGGVNIECILKKGWDCVNWIDLAQIRDMWEVVVGAVVKPGFP